MKIKISATFEGTCTVCGKESIVFTAGDEDTKKTVSICKDCAKNIGDVPTCDVIKKYGKVDEPAFNAEGIGVKSLDEMEKELEEKKNQRK